MSFPVFVLVALATYRVVRLITTDTLTEGWRYTVLRRWPPQTGPMIDPTGAPVPGSAETIPSWPVVLINCSWCMGVWISLVAVLVAHFTGLSNSWTLTGFDWPAIATVVGFLARLEA